MTKCPRCKQVAFPVAERGKFYSEICMDCGGDECFDCLRGECEGHYDGTWQERAANDAGSSTQWNGRA